MKPRTILLVVAFCLSVFAASVAADANVGSWKLNEKKSKIPAGAVKNNTVVYTAAGDSYKCVVDGVDASGKPAHNEWTGKFDGKDTRTMVLDQIRKHVGSQTKVDEARGMWGSHRWSYQFEGDV